MSDFVDTNILVDILRNHQPSLTWFSQQTPLNITPLVWMELIAGSRDLKAQRQAIKLLSQFNMVYLTTSDMLWAMQQHTAFTLSHNIGILDCLIASVNYRLQVPLYTHNLRHFTPLIGTLAQSPY